MGPWRRSRARRLVSRSAPASSILIICLGNICRSPYAEWRLRRELDGAGVTCIDIDSAGFIRPGRPSPALARRVAARRDVDLEGHRSKVLDEATLSGVELAVVMSPEQRRRLRRLAGSAAPRTLVLGDLDPHPADRRTIPDPFDRPEEVFTDVYERIDRCCRELAAVLAAGLDAPDDPKG